VAPSVAVVALERRAADGKLSVGIIKRILPRAGAVQLDLYVEVRRQVSVRKRKCQSERFTFIKTGSRRRARRAPGSTVLLPGGSVQPDSSGGQGVNSAGNTSLRC